MKEKVISPKVHHVDNEDEGKLYDQIMCADDVKDGDVFVAKNLGMVIVLISAWPTAVYYNNKPESLHTIKEGSCIGTLDEGKYKESGELAGIEWEKIK